MSAAEARYSRGLRIKEAAARGIRVVPKDPDPAEFPPRPFACDLRPRLCVYCGASCQYEITR